MPAVLELSEYGETVQSNIHDRIRKRIGEGAALEFQIRFRERIQNGEELDVAASEAQIEVVREMIEREQQVSI